VADDKIHEKDCVAVTGPMFEKEAELIDDILQAAGIPAKLAEPGPGNERYYVLSPQLKTAQVLVPKHMLEKARALLDAKEKEAESK